ncbi:protein translocase subunit SecD [Longirhabdus pacifica]|uniref:protein translocase subunit SecD n=1 Tax=Longirhabdus pacifica TaxID=2305227 RepID=UPI0010088E1E|nr:protein translocase subunit SecD [Longirhabdus pacifica]
MDKKRIVAFLVIIVALFSTMIWTGPAMLDDLKLGLDLKGGFERLYEVEPLTEGQEIDAQTLREAAYSLERRIYAKGVTEPEILPEGTNRIRVRLAGVENQAEVLAILEKTAILTFRSNLGCEDGEFCNDELIGSDFAEGGASVQYDPTTNAPYVSIKLKDAQKFYDVTKKIADAAEEQGLPGLPLAIYLDEEQISAPNVSNGIAGGDAMISGSYTLDEVKDLVSIINSGALPVKLNEKYTQSVDATLGEESLEKTAIAGIVGSVIIFVFMIIYYRIPGVVSVITLIAYIWLILQVFDWMNATLTLPGIAALILGVGMAVDANIITYERIKEEMKSGKSILSSLRAGSRNSLKTILDANVTTIIAGIVLYFVGTGAIQGFALSLVFSILVSVITNVFLSRALLHLLIRSKWVNKPSYFGVKEADISEL